MIEEPIIFLGIGLISLAMSSFLLSDRSGLFKPIALRFCFIGVIFHELAHYGMSLAVGEVPKGISIKWHHEKYRNERSPHGSVSPSEQPSFLQSIVIAFAPLYLSTWLIFLLLFGVIFTPLYDPVIKTISVIIVLSLLLTASPSRGDFRTMSFAFQKDPHYSWYQVFLISLSILILWGVLVITQFSFILDLFYYIAIAGIYLILKFSIVGLRNLIVRITSYDYKKPDKVRGKQFNRRRYKPKKSRADNE